MTDGLRKKATKLIRMGVSLGLILWLFSRFNLQGVWHAFEKLPLSLWIAACCALLVAQVLSSLRWWIIARALQFKGVWPTFLGFYFVGMFFNLFLPTGIGGDIFKIHYLSKGIGRKFAATLTVLGDRCFGLIAMVLVGAFCVLIWPGLLPVPLENGLLMGGSAMILILAGMPFIPKIFRRADSSLLKAVPTAVTQVQKPGTLFPILALSFSLQILGMGAVALMGKGMDIVVPGAFYFAALPMINIMTMIPITFNGIGVREGAFVYFLGLKGIEPEPALALGLLLFSIQVTISLMGGVLYAFGFHRHMNQQKQP